MTTTLVTGATGFVGGRLLDELLCRREPVRALVRDQQRAAALAERGIDVVVGDVCQPDTLPPALRGIEVVYHCAAAVGPSKSAAEIYATNRDGVRNLLDAARKAGSPRVVLLSSINVLGTRDLDPATEELSCRMSSDPAADVKIEAEEIALDCHRQHGLPVTILRPGFIYGPGDPHNLPRLTSAIQRGKFSFLGSRDNVIPIVHVHDVVQAMLLAGSKVEAAGRVYHITDGSRTTIAEFVDEIARLLVCPPPRKTLPLVVPRTACVVFELLQRLGIRKKAGPINRAGLRFLGTSRWVDIRRARTELKFSPQIQFREGLAETLVRAKEDADERTEFAHASG
jgi:nucleoside-diphosphate-sugar epimerase